MHNAFPQGNDPIDFGIRGAQTAATPADDKGSSLMEWKELYTAAVELKKIEPWAWMYDSDIFGVLNPASGEIGYCCIMGALGEVYALAVYLGTERTPSGKGSTEGRRPPGMGHGV